MWFCVLLGNIVYIFEEMFLNYLNRGIKEKEMSKWVNLGDGLMVFLVFWIYIFFMGYGKYVILMILKLLEKSNFMFVKNFCRFYKRFGEKFFYFY